jgi:adenine-specific DNA-methyltransferase
MIKNTKAKYILISYNDNGFISKDRIIEILAEKGNVTLEEIRYKNLNSRPSKVMKDKVNEYLFFVRCN